jgi:hypothetical protein
MYKDMSGHKQYIALKSIENATVTNSTTKFLTVNISLSNDWVLSFHPDN